MKVLVLGRINSPIRPIIQESGCEAVENIEPLTIEYVMSSRSGFIVSFGYRHIIKKDILDYLDSNVINLHVSYLPWNRGSDPNLWSFLEDTPKGVSIHYVDEKIDRGDIIVQKEVFFDETSETLFTSYKKLEEEIIQLFAAAWPEILAGTNPRLKQPSGGSFHVVADRKRVETLLIDGWQTSVRHLLGKGKFDRRL